MLKFLRKYKAIIMVFGGSLLMVVFLLPQAAQQFGQFDPMSATVARRDGEAVKGSEMRRVNQQIRIAKSVVPILFNPVYFGLPEDGDHWYLLTYEAGQAGLIGGPTDSQWVEEVAARREAQAFIEQTYPQQFWSSPEQFRNFMNREIPNAEARIAERKQQMYMNGFTDQQIGEAMAEVAGIMRMFQLYQTSKVLSRQEAVENAARDHDVVIVQAGILGPECVEEYIDLPSEEDLEAHFEAYKDVRASEDELGIGYLRPPALTVEWMTISRKAIEDGLTIDPIEANKFWREQRAQNPDIYPADFAEARERVDSALRRRKAAEAMDAMDTVIRRELQDSWRGLESDGNFRELPEDWPERRINLYDLASVVDMELAERFSVEGGMPRVTESDGVFRTEQELLTLPGFGGARVQAGGGREASMAAFLMQARELVPESQVGVQEGLLYGPARIGGPNGDRIYARILETRPESPPDSMAEVRDQMFEDIKLLRAMAYYRERLSEITEELSIEHNRQLQVPIVAKAEWVGVEVRRDSVVRSRVGQDMPEPRLNTEEFRDSVFAIVDEWDTKVRPDVMYAPEERTFGIVMPEARGFVIAQIRTRRPMTLEQYRESGGRITQLAQADFQAMREDAPYSLERMFERHNYEVVGRSEENIDESLIDNPDGSPEEPEAANESESGESTE